MNLTNKIAQNLWGISINSDSVDQAVIDTAKNNNIVIAYAHIIKGSFHPYLDICFFGAVNTSCFAIDKNGLGRVRLFLSPNGVMPINDDGEVTGYARTIQHYCVLVDQYRKSIELEIILTRVSNGGEEIVATEISTPLPEDFATFEFFDFSGEHKSDNVSYGAVFRLPQ